MSRPSVELGLVPVRDGNMWSVLWGANIQEGISGWGRSPEAAMADFDRIWGANVEDGQPVADEVLALRAQLRKANSLIVRAVFDLQACPLSATVPGAPRTCAETLERWAHEVIAVAAPPIERQPGRAGYVMPHLHAASHGQCRHEVRKMRLARHAHGGVVGPETWDRTGVVAGSHSRLRQVRQRSHPTRGHGRPRRGELVKTITPRLPSFRVGNPGMECRKCGSRTIRLEVLSVTRPESGLALLFEVTPVCHCGSNHIRHEDLDGPKLEEL